MFFFVLLWGEIMFGSFVGQKLFALRLYSK